MDAVIGLSMTPATVDLVLVEGQEAGGATIEHEAFAVRRHGPSWADDTRDRAVARTEAIAASRGLRLHSIGVTWSERSDAEASLLLRSLAASGFENVVPVRLPQATEALARGIADVAGFGTTTVCVVEPDEVFALTVRPGQDAVQTAASTHLVDGEAGLTDWLSEVFARADPRPDAVVVVGATDDPGTFMAKLEDGLAVPVFTPAEADAALARGAALAAASRHRFDCTEHGPGKRRNPWTPAQFIPLVMLIGGLVTLVVALALVINLP